MPNAAYVDVGGTIRIDADAAFWCSSHPYLGGSPRITCRKLIVAKGGKITVFFGQLPRRGLQVIVR